MWKSRRRGFTLWELSACLAIVGVLSAFAIPEYQTMLVRTKITELRAASRVAKLVIGAHVFTHDRLPDTDEVDLGSTTKFRYLESVVWNGETLFTKANAVAMGLREGEELMLVFHAYLRAGTVVWECETRGLRKYATVECPAF